jgi:hypothetical protein
MRIEPSGVIFKGICDIQTDRCLAKQTAPVTAVWGAPGRSQINVCRPCLEEKVRAGEWEIQGAHIPRRADVAVYSPDRKLQVVVEVKKSARINAGPLKQRATQIHRNLLAHAGLPKAAYFLLAILPGYFYLWKEDHVANLDRQPDYEINANEILKPYFDGLSVPPEHANDFELEKLVSSWLSDVAKSPPPTDKTLQWLQDSGLYESLKDGLVEIQAPLAA